VPVREEHAVETEVEPSEAAKESLQEVEELQEAPLLKLHEICQQRSISEHQQSIHEFC